MLKRGFTTDKALHDWFEESSMHAKDRRRTRPARSSSTTAPQTEVARFNLEQCWPSKLSVSDLSAGSDEVMVEELTIQHEFLDWV